MSVSTNSFMTDLNNYFNSVAELIDVDEDGVSIYNHPIFGEDDGIVAIFPTGRKVVIRDVMSFKVAKVRHFIETQNLQVSLTNDQIEALLQDVDCNVDIVKDMVQVYHVNNVM